jgi:hypothetical protein
MLNELVVNQIHIIRHNSGWGVTPFANNHGFACSAYFETRSAAIRYAKSHTIAWIGEYYPDLEIVPLGLGVEYSAHVRAFNHYERIRSFNQGSEYAHGFEAWGRDESRMMRG